jgi:hypothetical protein
MPSYKIIPPGDEWEFAIYRTHYRMASLLVHLNVRPRDVLALKRAVPEFSDISIFKLGEVTQSGTYEFVPFGEQEAARRLAPLKQQGLCVTFTPFIMESDLLMNEHRQIIHLIEDFAKDRNLIFEQAIQRGVRVVECEKDGGGCSKPWPCF